jgi:RNase P/RNase MRP subunit p30
MENPAKEPSDSGSEIASVSEGCAKNLSKTGEASQLLKTQEIASAQAEKARAIREACALRDIDALTAHATSKGGLLEDGLRQLACEFDWFRGSELD